MYVIPLSVSLRARNGREKDIQRTGKICFCRNAPFVSGEKKKKKSWMERNKHEVGELNLKRKKRERGRQHLEQEAGSRNSARQRGRLGRLRGGGGLFCGGLAYPPPPGCKRVHTT